jgi:hypothetical protein
LTEIQVTRARWALRLFLLMMGTLVLVWQLSELTIPLGDFVEYWTASEALLLGESPYAPDILWSLQQGIGHLRPRPLLMYNPPWILSLTVPFSLLDHISARLAWLVFHFVCLFASATMLWKIYSGSYRGLLTAWILTLTFLPTSVALVAGQLGPLLLLGYSCFIFGVYTQRWSIAGLGIVLASFKPQVAMLLWPALLVWLWRGRHWPLFRWTLVVLVAFLAMPMAMIPEIIVHYVALLFNHAPVEWVTPTVGSLLRFAFGAEYFWLQFIPLVPGLLWLAWHLIRSLDAWDWREQMPLLLLISFVTSPYVWPHDATVLLLPVLAVAARLRGLPFEKAWQWVGGYAVILGIVWAARLGTYSGMVWFVGFAPALLALYCLMVRSQPWHRSFVPELGSVGCRSEPVALEAR